MDFTKRFIRSDTTMHLSVADRSVTVKCYVAAAAMYISVAADTFGSYVAVVVYEQEIGGHVNGDLHKGAESPRKLL